jgi:hypothetical protein
MKDLWRLLYRDCRHYAFGHFQRRGQTSAWSHCYHNRQSEIHFFVRYTFFGIHAEKCMSCVVFLVNQRSCQVLESFSSHGIAHASITVCQKSPLFWYIYTQPRKWVYYVNAQRLEWKQALSFAVLQLALGSFLVLKLTYFDSVPPPPAGPSARPSASSLGGLSAPSSSEPSATPFCWSLLIIR